MTLEAITAEDIALLEKAKRFGDKANAIVAERVAQKTSAERRIWFCAVGRKCNGKPHLGAPYKHARGDQWPPPGVDWDVWFYMSGRGVGKTKAGGNWARQMALVTDRIALVGRRGKDVRSTMVEGPSGLIKTCEAAGETYDWKPALMEFTFENGAKAFGFSAEEPESLRGPEHGAGWFDEPCHMDLIEEVWSNYNLGLRSEGVPGGAKTLLTSSPLPVPWTKERIAEQGQIITDELGDPIIDEETGKPERAPRTVLVQVPTSVNLDNLDAGYKRRVINPLRGTRKGKQELDAMLLEDVEGALWEADWLYRKAFKRVDCDRVVVSVDPAGSDSKTADLTGIVVVGRMGEEYGVFEDATDHFTPNGWAKKAIALYRKYSADAIVLERYGGDSATVILRNAGFKGKIVEVKARVGKATRAEPISALYEQKCVAHLNRAELSALEDQMLTWVPSITKKSPDRVDALVWALTELAKRRGPAGSIGVPRRRDNGPRNSGPRNPRKNWSHR